MQLAVDVNKPRHLEVLNRIQYQATEEHSLKVNIEAVARSWKECSLEVEISERLQLNVLRNGSSVLGTLDELIVKTQLMKGSSYARLYERELARVTETLTTVHRVILQCISCQDILRVLKPVFLLSGTFTELSEGGKIFRVAELLWQMATARLANSANFEDFLRGDKKEDQVEDGNDGKHENNGDEKERKKEAEADAIDMPVGWAQSFAHIFGQLEHVLGGVKTFMRDKRDIFPRLYFLSDGDLLTLLACAELDGMSGELNGLVSKCFTPILAVEWEQKDVGQHIICAVAGRGGESVDLSWVYIAWVDRGREIT